MPAVAPWVQIYVPEKTWPTARVGGRHLCDFGAPLSLAGPGSQGTVGATLAHKVGPSECEHESMAAGRALGGSSSGSEAAGSCPGTGLSQCDPGRVRGRRQLSARSLAGARGGCWGVEGGGPCSVKLFRGPGSPPWAPPNSTSWETSPCDGQVTSRVRTRLGGLPRATLEVASLRPSTPPWPDRGPREPGKCRRVGSQERGWRGWLCGE